VFVSLDIAFNTTGSWVKCFKFIFNVDRESALFLINSFKVCIGMPLKVLIFGHSFVRRLDEYLSASNIINADLDQNDFHVSFFAMGGLTVNRAWQNIEFIKTALPDIVILNVGDNDLDNASFTSSTDVREAAVTVVEFANHLLTLNVKVVFIIPAYHRSSPRLDDYEQCLPYFNESIRTICKTLYRVVFWPHRNMTENWIKFISHDGIHYNNDGNARYLRCVKRAIFRAADIINSGANRAH
jgi:hypothetical protein